MKTNPLFVAAGAETNLESTSSLSAPARPVNIAVSTLRSHSDLVSVVPPVAVRSVFTHAKQTEAP